MTAHGVNIGSRKVELEKQSQPLWRLKANYLLRQLARIWYGKIPERAYPNSADFEVLFLDVMCQFVEDHGGNSLEVHKRIKQQKEEFWAIHGKEIKFRDRVSELDWMVNNGIPKTLHDAFANDEVVQNIILFVEWLLAYEEEGKEPPFERAEWMESLDYYEQLPVLEPEPRWRLIANYLAWELACVWYGKTKALSDDFYRFLKKLLFVFAIDKGLEGVEVRRKVAEAAAEFEAIHDCALEFRTPVQEVIWTARKGLPEHLAAEFLSDPQVKFILTATELILALIKAGYEPPYERYAVCFQSLEEYEKRIILSRERLF